jgi:hypothetical protein
MSNCESRKNFQKPLAFFVIIVNTSQKILEKTTRLSIKIDPHIRILQGE